MSPSQGETKESTKMVQVTMAYVSPARRNLHRELAIYLNLFLANGRKVTVFPPSKVRAGLTLSRNVA